MSLRCFLVYAFLVTFSISSALAQENVLQETEAVAKQEAKDIEPYQKIRVGIFINGRSTDLYTWFGHAGVVLSGPKAQMQAVALDNRENFSSATNYSGEALAFDYGNFDSSSNFLYRFLIGKLEYYKLVRSYDNFVATNNILQKRGLSVYWLNLSPQQTRKFARILFYETSPKRALYKYHFYFDNCLTRIRDQLDQVFDGGLSSQITGNSKLSVRQILRREIGDKFWGLLLLEYLQGSVIDQKYSRWDSTFFPSQMPDLLKSLKLPGTERTLLAEEEILFPYSEKELESRHTDIFTHKNMFFLSLYALSFLLLSFFLWRRQRIFPEKLSPLLLRSSSSHSLPLEPSLEHSKTVGRVTKFWGGLAKSSYWLICCSAALVIGTFSGVSWLLNALRSFDVAMQNVFVLLGTPFLILQILLLPFLFFSRTRLKAVQYTLYLWRIHFLMALLLPLFAWLYALATGQLMQDLFLSWLAILPILAVASCLPQDLYLHYCYNNKKSLSN